MCPYVLVNANAPADVGIPVAIALAVIIFVAGVGYGIRQVHTHTYPLDLSNDISYHHPIIEPKDTLPARHLNRPCLTRSQHALPFGFV